MYYVIDDLVCLMANNRLNFLNMKLNLNVFKIKCSIRLLMWNEWIVRVLITKNLIVW